MATGIAGISFALGRAVPDFVITSAEGEERLLVEVKSRTPAEALSDSNWLDNFRRELGQYGCHYLLVTAEKMTLFLPGQPGTTFRTIQQDSSLVLASYWDLNRVPLDALGNLELRGVVRSWLGSIIFKPAAVLLENASQAWLVESGLHSQIYKGYITRELRAA